MNLSRRHSRPAARRPTLDAVFLVSLAAGAVLGLLFLPSSWAWLAPIPLAVVFAHISGAARPRAAFAAGFAAGLGFFAVHLAWLPASFGRLFGPAGAVATLLVPAAVALLWGLTAALTRLAAGPHTLAALPFAWVVMEFGRGLGPLAFPWGALGYALLPTPLVQVVDLGGVGLASLLVAGSAGAVVALARGAARPALLVGGLLAGAGAYGLTRPIPPAADRTALVVQGAIDPLEKASRRREQELEQYLALTRRGLAGGPVDLVVWPEAASPAAPTDPAVRRALAALGVPLVLGAPTVAGGQYRNSVYAFRDGWPRGYYDKVTPVPFGEFFPWRRELAFVYDPVFAAMGLPRLLGTTPGSDYRTLPLGPEPVGSYISYESVLPAAAREMTARGARLLVHVSNDAWFAGTAGKEQHFQMGRLRAIENRRYVVRASNDGISAVIDPLGRVIARFPGGEPGAFRSRYALADSLSPYVRLGDWPVFLSALVLSTVVLSAPLAARPHPRSHRVP